MSDSHNDRAQPCPPYPTMSDIIERLRAAVDILVTEKRGYEAEIERLESIVIAQDSEIERLRQKLDKAAEALAQVLGLPYPPQKGS